jgi:hypothetical protein
VEYSLKVNDIYKHTSIESLLFQQKRRRMAVSYEAGKKSKKLEAFFGDETTIAQ